MSIPSIRIYPDTGSYILNNKLVIVDLPEPDSPTKATFCPFFMSKWKFLNIGSGRLSYLNSIS